MAADAPAADVARPSRVPQLRHWRVRTKLAAILVIPMLALGVFAWFGASGLIQDSRTSGQVVQLAQVGRTVSVLVDGLQQERTLVAGRVAGATGLDADIKTQRAKVDAAVATFTTQARGIGSGYSRSTRTTLSDAQEAIGALAGVRRAADTQAAAGSAEGAYSGIISRLNAVTGGISQGSSAIDLIQSVRALDSISRAKEFLATQQSQLYGTLSGPAPYLLAPGPFRDFFTAEAEESQAEQDFTNVATTNQSSLYESTVDGSVATGVTALTGTVFANQARDLDIRADVWKTATDAKLQAMQSLQTSVLGDVTRQANKIRESARNRALLQGVIILAVLGLAILATVVVARSIVRPLLALRSGALDVADHRLPEAVRRLRDSGGEAPNVAIQPIGVDSREEIGEVARAFDAVHREAVHLATEQAALRNNVSSMFVNLSRRSQSLVERQLRLIDDLENRERDPDQLSNLFKLDHLATRMRRNDENLLVLSGTEASRRWTHPVPVSEVVLAAIAEVEQYTRISHTASAPQAISGNAVSDVVHLVAELLENATAFSPPTTDVTVTSHALGGAGGTMIEIEDTGIGIPAKELEQINERLVNPPVVDVSVSRTMGLFVVGRLAARHGVRVQLRESPGGGITALVRLPAKLTVSTAGGAPAQPSTAAVNGRPEPRVPAARAMPSAATSNGSGPAAPNGRNGAPHRIDPRSHTAGAKGPIGGRPAELAKEPDQDGLRPAPPDVGSPFPVRPAAGGPLPDRGRPAADQPALPPAPVVRPAADADTGRRPAAAPPVTGPGGSLPSRAAARGGPEEAPPAIPGPAVGPDPVNDAAPGPDRVAGRRQAPDRGRPLNRRPAAPASAAAPAPAVAPAAPVDGRPARVPASMPVAGGDTSEDPMVREALDAAGLPIFESVSEWFRRRTPAPRADQAVPESAVGTPLARRNGGPAGEPRPAQPPAAQPALVQSPATPPPPLERRPEVPVAAAEWQSPGDDGWRAAEAAAAPRPGGTTRAGLPKRVPMTNLVPGSAEAPTGDRPEPAAAATRSPELVGSRLASYYRGVREGRGASAAEGDSWPRKDQENT